MNLYDLFKIVYSKKYRAFGARYFLRHCIILRRGGGPGPRNYLVELRNGERVVIPWGNLIPAGKVRLNF